MTTVDLLNGLVETTLAGSLAIMVVMLVRRPVRTRFGAAAGYGVWWLVPSALVAVLVPAATSTPIPVTEMLTMIGSGVPAGGQPVESRVDVQAWLALAWCLGAIAMAVRFAHQQSAFRRGLGVLRPRAEGAHQADIVSGLPAVIGLWRPLTVVPVDFDTRYSAEQRVLLVAHERIHVARLDHWSNALVAGLRTVFWFNPLVHVAAPCFRHDQELACDQRVLALHPASRRAYGEAMLSTQMASQPLPVGCHWGQGHPLKERIEMLRKPLPTFARRCVGFTCVLVLVAMTGLAAWAAQPSAVVADEGRQYLVTRSTELPGHATSGELSQYIAEGESAASVFGEGAERWRVTVTPVRGPRPGTVTVRSTVERGTPFQIVMEPTIVVDEGEPATIEQRGPDGVVLFRQTVLAVVVGSPAEVAEEHESAGEPSGSRIAAPLLTPPKYPAAAVTQRTEGTVVLLVDIDEAGNVLDAIVETADPPGIFDQSAVDAARQWRFQPELENGRPVKSRVRVPVEFAMDPPAASEG